MLTSCMEANLWHWFWVTLHLSRQVSTRHVDTAILQPMHLLVIFGIALMVFGPKKLPELGKGIGDGIRGFKSAMKEQDAAAGEQKAGD